MKRDEGFGFAGEGVLALSLSSCATLGKSPVISELVSLSVKW